MKKMGLLIILLISTAAIAENRYFVCPNSVGDWHIATNWSPQQIPGPNDNVYIDELIGFGDGVCEITQPAECNSIYIGWASEGYLNVRNLFLVRENLYLSYDVYEREVFPYGTIAVFSNGRVVVMGETDIGEDADGQLTIFSSGDFIALDRISLKQGMISIDGGRLRLSPEGIFTYQGAIFLNNGGLITEN